MGCSYLARKEGAKGSSLQPQVQVGERGEAHQPNLWPDTRWRVEDEDAKGKWTCCTQGAQELSPHSQYGLAPEPSSPLALASVPQDQRLTPQDSPPRLPRCAGCQAGISPRMFSADLSLTAQEQEGQRGPRPRPLGSTSFLFSLHPALLWLTSCRGLRKWSGLGPRAGSLGPHSQHPDCNNGSFKHQEKRQTLTEAPGEQTSQRGNRKRRQRERKAGRGSKSNRERQEQRRREKW